jgi:GntR family transcriptional regulator, arabinose operon transcriptional repressor
MNSLAKGIYNTILKDILDKKLTLGDRIATEMEFAEQFTTNRMNARIAVKQLEDDGIVSRQKRKGTFIKKVISEESIMALRNLNIKIVHVFLALHNPNSFIQWNENTISELEALLNNEGFSLVFNEIPDSRTALLESFEEIEDSGSRCIVFFPTLDDSRDDITFLKKNVDLISKYRGDIFLFNRGTSLPQSLPCHSLSLDPFSEGLIAGMYLLQKKLTKVVFLSIKDDFHYWSEQRFEGLQAGLRGSSFADIDVDILYCSYKTPFNSAQAFLQESGNQSVIVAQNDNLAAKFIDDASEKGLKAGRDYRLLSFDNDPRLRKYNLTTIAPPTEKLAKVLAQMVTALEWKKMDGMTFSLRIKSKIIERSTC